MGNSTRILGALGMGAAMMYVLDPDRGRRRRALMRDQVVSGFGDLLSELEKASRDFGNRARGVAAGLRALLPAGDCDDDILVARVRAKIGRAVRHPGAISVRATHGRVTLEGPVLEHERARLVSAVSSVACVKEVEDRLDSHPQAGDVPGLQGGRPRRERWEILQSNWTPALRLLAGAGGAVLVFDGMRRRSVPGFAGALSGAALLARATSNREFKRIAGAGGVLPAVDIRKTMNILAPVEEVFAFWTDYQNLPRFMTHLKEVRDLGNGRSHWIAEGPAGTQVSWDAEVTGLVPNKLVAWKSVPGSRIEHSGSVRFDRNSDGGTRISVRMCYSPPAGMVGHVLAALFRHDPKREMDDDLVRLKSLIEFGKTRAHGRTVRWEQLRHAPTA